MCDLLCDLMGPTSGLTALEPQTTLAPAWIPWALKGRPCVESFIPSLVLLGNGSHLQGWGLPRGSQTSAMP